MISIIHPSRGRAQKSFETMKKWVECSSLSMEIIVSLDHDDIHLKEYENLYHQDPFFTTQTTLLFENNVSSVAAINHGAKHAKGHIIIVVSDDTDCYKGWDNDLYKVLDGKYDFILKTQDGIQPWIITMPVMDRAYFNRTGHIYHPGFEHMFCDTWMSVMADVTGRRITSNLLFPHLNDSIKDDVRKKTDATWAQGEKTFINLCKSLPKEDLRKITDQSMINWLRNKGVR